MQSAGIFLRIIDTAFDSFDSSFVQLYFCCFTGSLMGYFLGFLLKFDQRWIAFSVAAALTVNFTFCFFFFPLSLHRITEDSTGTTLDALKARIRELEKQILRGDRYKCLICMV